jgi:hypothetical protein
MILNKVTTGFVIQQYDTETKKFVSQEFIAGDDVAWEESGEPVDPPEGNPYLYFHMIQPE